MAPAYTKTGRQDRLATLAKLRRFLAVTHREPVLGGMSIEQVIDALDWALALLALEQD